jgi:hypothetical protein
LSAGTPVLIDLDFLRRMDILDSNSNFDLYIKELLKQTYNDK